MFSAKRILVLICCLLCFQTARSAEWTQQKSGTLSWLHDVYFTSEKKGFIAGSGGTLLATVDGGATWTKQNISTADRIEQIHFTNENTGWLLCQRDKFNRGAGSPSYLLKTVDGGTHWARADFNQDGRERIAKIFSAANGLTFAIGEAGVAFVFDDARQTWKRIAAPTRYLLLDGAFADDFRAAIVGAGGSVFFSEDAGASWNTATVYGGAKTRLNRIFFINKNSGYAVGAAGAIYQTLNGGKSWRAQTSNVSVDLTDVFFSNTAEGWAIGDGGALLHTMTGGNVWTPVEANTKHKLERVFFHRGRGFAVGFGGTILSFDRRKTVVNSSAKPQMLKRSN